MVKIDTHHKFNSALIGMILFDGSMNKEDQLYLRHGKGQFEYVSEKVHFLKNYLKPKSIRECIDNNGYEYKYAYYKNEHLKYLYNKIYINGKKKLSKTILNRFDEITLAIMYLDDGCLSLRKDPKYEGNYKSREIHLNVQSFSMEEVKMLQSQLRLRWNVDFHLTYDKGKPRLWCNTKNTIKFLEIVAPIIRYNFPSMYYKLDLKYKRKNINFLPKN